MKKLLYIFILIIFSFCIRNGKVNAYTEYKIGDVVPYNGMDFYVIKDSGSKDDSVTLLKAEPLTVDEVNLYGVGHINRYTYLSVGTAYDRNGYGGMAFYSSETCGYANNSFDASGCTTDYMLSEVKYVVDAWKTAKAPLASEARLLTINEATGLGYEWYDNGSLAEWQKVENVPSWLYNSDYWYWIGNQCDDFSTYVWSVNNSGGLICNFVSDHGNLDGTVRPVIVLSKTVFEKTGEDEDKIDKEKENDLISKNSEKQNIIDSRDDKIDNIIKATNELKIAVKVDNTYQGQSFLLIALGFIIASISVCVFYKLSNKKR